jgi:hypothetical protein
VLRPPIPQGVTAVDMVGQWAGIPGVSMVAAMGRVVVQTICRQDRRVFKARVTTSLCQTHEAMVRKQPATTLE